MRDAALASLGPPWPSASASRTGSCGTYGYSDIDWYCMAEGCGESRPRGRPAGTLNRGSEAIRATGGLRSDMTCHACQGPLAWVGVPAAVASAPAAASTDDDVTLPLEFGLESGRRRSDGGTAPPTASPSFTPPWSRVPTGGLLLRHLPSSCTEEAVVAALRPYARVERVTLGIDYCKKEERSDRDRAADSHRNWYNDPVMTSGDDGDDVDELLPPLLLPVCAGYAVVALASVPVAAHVLTQLQRAEHTTGAHQGSAMSPADACNRVITASGCYPAVFLDVLRLDPGIAHLMVLGQPAAACYACEGASALLAAGNDARRVARQEQAKAEVAMEQRQHQWRRGGGAAAAARVDVAGGAAVDGHSSSSYDPAVGGYAYRHPASAATVPTQAQQPPAGAPPASSVPPALGRVPPPPYHAATSSSYTFDPQSGYLWHGPSSFYYDAAHKLYLDPLTSSYFTWSEDGNTYIPWIPPLPTEPWTWAGGAGGIQPAPTSSDTSATTSASDAAAHPPPPSHSAAPAAATPGGAASAAAAVTGTAASSIAAAVRESLRMAQAGGGSSSSIAATVAIAAALTTAPAVSLVAASLVPPVAAAAPTAPVSAGAAAVPAGVAAVCTICNRGFASADKLKLHEQQSQLHKDNLALQQKQLAAQG